MSIKKSQAILKCFIDLKNSVWFIPGGGGGLGISSDGDDRRIFFGFEIFDSGIFLGTKIWQVFFWVA